ncbi:hypothetical protein N7509_008915 [Penicillium cosmopolitanum]|uniref:Ribonuclease H2 subunit B n=1 Tax=Penicillium cosmopolitanum TaxID=1131564 RepID=A0A9X0B336_9EURO|nr:uncharacterized protein N7509_008915 [Penicillium cosmopolitanum]KAJ5386374.1 hypothetical protein N7509_008915 [Penicillium cosmopolitanum]
MPRTRASAPAKATEEKPEVEQKKQLTTAEKPSKTFILPSSTSANARLLSLPNPQSGELTRYFFCPERGIYEFTVVASPTTSPRSILFTPRMRQTTTASPDEETDTQTTSIAKKAELLVATPIDSIFFLIALFNATAKSGQSLFQPLDDIIDSNDDLPQHLRNVLYDDTFRNTLVKRAEAICDTVEAGDEKMLRFSEAKLLNELVAKADRLATQGLPASLEERFVRQPLAPPLMSVKREDALTGQVPSNGDASSKSEEGQDSPSTAATSATPSVSTPAGESTPAPQPPTDNSTSDKIAHLQRVSTALTFMKDSYLPASLCSRIDEMLASPESPLDLKPLTDRIKEIAALRAEALASRTLTDFSRKRGLDDEEVESRAEKKRKKDDEDKKAKAMESRGIRDLKKVNTTGMKKMSDFFGKAAARKKT